MISKKVSEDKDIRLIVIAFYVVSSVLMARTLSLYSGLVSTGTSINSMFVGLFSVCTYALFPMRKLFPDQFKEWGIFKIYILFHIALIVFYVALLSGSKFETFTPLEVIGSRQVFKFDIIFRFIATALSFGLSITPAIVALSRKGRREDETNSRLTTIYSIGIIGPGLCILFLFLLPDLFYTILFVYQVWVCLFSVAMTYFVYSKKQAVLELPEPNLAISVDVRAKLWGSIEGCMHDSEPWRDPEFKLNTLSAMVLSNRTTVSALIHDQGYKNFQDYVAWYRIKAFCDYAKNNYVGNITDAFVDVGFQSPSSAFKHFKLIHGITPSQYLESLKK